VQKEEEKRKKELEEKKLREIQKKKEFDKIMKKPIPESSRRLTEAAQARINKVLD
jgi:histidyl-tRNA synthetase